jgi:nucleoside-diphosphate-sugar epimerase
MSRPGYDAVLLVTGFPSLYARKMVRHILAAEPGALVYAIVPGECAARAEAEREALDAVRVGDRQRLVLVEGDASAMDLGLSGAEFRQLAREVDRIHHLAHVAAGSVDRKTARAVNVVGAGEILELARAARATGALERLVFHSTAHVSGDRTGVVYEDDLASGQSFRSEVEETRMQAESLARRAMREVPIAVVRPTTLVGDLDPIEDERLDGLYLLVLLIVATPAEIAIPFPGKGDSPLNIVPIDFVVRAAHALGRAAGAAGRTFHLADPHPLSARRVAELVARAGGKRTARSHIPSNLAKALLRTPGVERFVRSPRAFVEQLTTAVRYDTRNTDVMLRGTDIACPSFETYVGELVATVQEHLKARQKRRDTPAELEVDDPLS